MEWMLMPLRRYAEFSGRSRRKEYWMYTLGIVILFIVLGIVFGVVAGTAITASSTDPMAATGMLASMGVFGIILGVVWLGLIIPSLAVTVRRLHDTDRTGWWMGGLVGLAVLSAVISPMSSTLGTIIYIAYLALALVLLVFMFLPGTAGPNRFGEDPKGTGNAEVFA